MYVSYNYIGNSMDRQVKLWLPDFNYCLVHSKVHFCKYKNFHGEYWSTKLASINDFL